MQQPPGPGLPPPPGQGYPSTQGHGTSYGAPSRPGAVTAAAVLLIVVGSLTALFGVLFIIAGAVVSGADLGPFDNLGGAVIVIGILVVTYGVFEIISGARVLALRNGWRVAGIVFAAIGVFFSAVSLISAITSGNRQTFDFQGNQFTVGHGPNIGGIITAVISLAIYLVILIALARNRRYFQGSAPPRQWPPPQQQYPPGQFTA